MARSKRKTPESIPADQWKLPVTVDSDENLVTLREAAEGERSFLSLSALTLDQRARVTEERLKKLKTFDIASIGAGVMNKNMALQEVRNKSPIGRNLIEIEQRMISHLLSLVSKQ